MDETTGDDVFKQLQKLIDAIRGDGENNVEYTFNDGVLQCSITKITKAVYDAGLVEDDLISRIVADMREEIDTQAWLNESWNLPAYEGPNN